MLISNDNCYFIVYDGGIDRDAEHIYNWRGYYYAVQRLSEGVIKRYAEIHESVSYDTVLKVTIEKEVKA